MKKVLAILLIVALLLVSAVGFSQTNEYRTVTLSGTADVLIDSSLTSTIMKNKRAYINNVYLWWNNGANTNDLAADIVSGTSALRVAGSQRAFHHVETMASSGIKTVTFTPNIMTPADSTLYFAINATGSDTLYMVVTYKLISD